MNRTGNKIARPVVHYPMGTGANRSSQAARMRSARVWSARDNHVAIIGNRVDFERVFMPHLDGAYNLARWLLRNDADAEDVVQEAYLRALRFAGNYRGGDARAWLLAIVRNAAYTWISRNRRDQLAPALDDDRAPEAAHPVDVEVIRRADAAMVRAAIEELPAEFREMVVLRDLEELSYKEIAMVSDLPIGTVMSRLARARARLRAAIQKLSAAGGSR